MRRKINQTGKSNQRQRDVQMHPSKFREMGTGPGDAAPDLLPPFLSPTPAPSAQQGRRRGQFASGKAPAPPVLEKALSQQNRTEHESRISTPRASRVRL